MINDAVHWSADLGGGTRVALVQAGTFRSDAGAIFGPVPRLLWDHLVTAEIDLEMDPATMMTTCPSCGRQLVDRGCKLICACGYFLSCSDYY